MKRKQLTLFLDEIESIPIESIRRKFNPKQYSLIKSHITLCREDEIEELTSVQMNLEKMDFHQFELKTNGLRRFSKGKGVFISVEDEENEFGQLRNLILQNLGNIPREHEAHITLMHPKNSTCTDEKFRAIEQIELPQTLSIKKISLIEQEIGKEWKTLKEFRLKAENDI
ncbi:MAG: 2'-5' RNA ligase family protein [Crocinitomicaceae bacterium]